MVVISKGTGGARGMSRRAGNVRSGLVNAFLPANPFGGLTLVIVAIAGKPVTVRAEGNAVFVEAALESVFKNVK